MEILLADGARLQQVEVGSLRLVALFPALRFVPRVEPGLLRALCHPRGCGFKLASPLQIPSVCVCVFLAWRMEEEIGGRGVGWRLLFNPATYVAAAAVGSASPRRGRGRSDPGCRQTRELLHLSGTQRQWEAAGPRSALHVSNAALISITRINRQHGPFSPFNGTSASRASPVPGEDIHKAAVDDSNKTETA